MHQDITDTDLASHPGHASLTPERKKAEPHFHIVCRRTETRFLESGFRIRINSIVLCMYFYTYLLVVMVVCIVVSNIHSSVWQWPLKVESGTVFMPCTVLRS